MRWLAGLCGLLASASAYAHGAAPAALGILTTDGDAPTIFRLSRGLAIPGISGPRFICQSRWGGPDATLAMGSPEGVAYAVGKAGVFRISANGEVSAVGPSTVHAGNTRALVVDADGPVALLVNGDVMRLGETAHTTLFSMPGADSLAVDGQQLLVLRGEEGVLTLRETGVDVELSAAYPATPTLVVAGGARFVAGASSQGYRIDRIDGTTLTSIATSDDPILGPVADGATVYGVLSGALYRLEGDAFVATAATTSRLSCLDATSVGLTGCTLPDLVALNPNTGAGETHFVMADLQPPSLSGLEGQAVKDCQLDWLDIAVDAGLPDERLVPAEWETPAPVAEPSSASEAESTASSSGDGCGVGLGGTRPAWPAGGLLAVLLALRWVRRAAP